VASAYEHAVRHPAPTWDPQLLQSFGWSDVFDLGDITAAHGPEMMMAITGRCFQRLGSVPFNIKLVH
jgi:hypothetical protein